MSERGGPAAARPAPPAAQSSQRRSNSGGGGNGEAAAADPPVQNLVLSEAGEGGEVRRRRTLSISILGKPLPDVAEPLELCRSDLHGSCVKIRQTLTGAGPAVQVYEAIHYEGDPQQSGHVVTTACNRGGTRHILRYVAERIVGNGSFGVVFQATCLETKETVAIKRVLQDKRFKNRELQIMRCVRTSPTSTCFWQP